MSESFSSWSMSRTMSRSAASRPVFRVLQRAWRMYSTDSFEFDLINSGKWPHKLRSILSTVSCLPQQNNATPCSKFSLEFEVKTLLALEVEVKMLRVRESFPCSTSSSFYQLLRLCAFYHWNRLTDWKAIRKGQLFHFWVVGGLDCELGFNWAQDDSLNLLKIGLGWAWLMIWIQWDWFGKDLMGLILNYY